MGNPLTMRPKMDFLPGHYLKIRTTSVGCANSMLVTIMIDSLLLARSLLEDEPQIPVPLAMDLDGTKMLLLVDVDVLRVLDCQDGTILIVGRPYACCSPDFGYLTLPVGDQSSVRVVLDAFTVSEATGEMTIVNGT